MGGGDFKEFFVVVEKAGQRVEEKEKTMRIEITQDDIDKGRMRAGKRCGCPIWQAVVRQLQIPESQAEALMQVPDYWTVKLGNTKFKLPEEAVTLQRILVEYPLAHIEPCVFEAPVRDFSDPEKPQAKKPTLFERVFGK